MIRLRKLNVMLAKNFDYRRSCGDFSFTKREALQVNEPSNKL